MGTPDYKTKKLQMTKEREISISTTRYNRKDQKNDPSHFSFDQKGLVLR